MSGTPNPDQYLPALERANRSRSMRAQFRRRVGALSTRSGRIEVCALIYEPPDWAERWRVAEVLTCIAFVGPSKADRICRRSLTARYIAIGKLTARQRSAIVDILEGMYA